MTFGENGMTDDPMTKECSTPQCGMRAAAMPRPLGHWGLEIDGSLDHRSLAISVFRGPGVERIAQAVAEEVQREKRERKNDTRINEQPGIFLDVLRAFVDEHAQGTHRRLHSEAEEAQRRFQQHHTWNGERGVNDGDAEN